MHNEGGAMPLIVASSFLPSFLHSFLPSFNADIADEAEGRRRVLAAISTFVQPLAPSLHRWIAVS